MSLCEVLTEEILLKTTKKTKLNNITRINFYFQNLSEISIVAKLTKLEIASLSGNNITTLRHFTRCPCLRELFIRNNKIDNFDEVQYLTELTSLKTLWLMGNPISYDENYREKVIYTLPSINKLDDIEISDIERMATSISSRKQSNGSAPSNDVSNGSILASDASNAPKMSLLAPEKHQTKQNEAKGDVRPPRENASHASNYHEDDPSKSRSGPSIQKPQVKLPPTLLSPSNRHQHSNSQKYISISSGVLPPLKTESRHFEDSECDDEQPSDANLLKAVLNLLPELSSESMEVVVTKIRELTK